MVLRKFAAIFVASVFFSAAHAQVPIAGPFQVRNSLSEGNAAQIRLNLGLPSATVYFPAACDTTTDNGPGLRALIATAQSSTVQGTTIDVPNCVMAVGGDVNGNALPIAGSNIGIRGAVGGGGLITQTTAASDYLGSNSGSVLVALASVTNAMVIFDPAAGTDGIKGGGLKNITLAGMNLAPYGLIVNSMKGGEFRHVTVEKATTTGVTFGASANSLLNPNSGQNQLNAVNDLNILEGWAANTLATGLVWTGGTGTDVSEMNWASIYISHQAGVGFDCVKADSNIITGMNIYARGATGSIGYHMLLRSSLTAPACRSNTFGIMTSVVAGSTDPGVYVQGHATYNNGGNFKNAINYNTSQFPNPLTNPVIMEPTDHEYPPAYFTLDSGITNVNPGTSDDLMNNTTFWSDSRSNNTASTPCSSGSYVFDEWRFVGTLFCDLTFQIKNAPPTVPGVAWHVGQFSVAAQSVPASTDYVSLCNRVAGQNIVSTGFGNSGQGAAKSLVLSFWDYEAVAGPYSAYLGNTDLSRTLVVNWTITTANTWTYVSVVVPGDTTGNWLKGIGTIGIQFCKDLGSGSNFQTATPNVWLAGNFHSSASSIALISQPVGTVSLLSNVRLYAGSADIPFIQKQNSVEVTAGLRNYYKSFAAGTLVMSGVQTNGTIGMVCTVPEPAANADLFHTLTLPQEMETIPTFTFYNPVNAVSGSWRVVPSGGAWQPLTAYVTSTPVLVVTNNNNLYALDVGGTSGTVISGGPSGTSTTPGSIMDGTATWHYLGPAYITPVQDPLSTMPGGYSTAGRRSLLIKFSGAIPQLALICGQFTAGGGV